MDIARHPELLDRLAAAYALGTLRGGARRRFEQQARQSAAVRASALVWQERLAALTELQPVAQPSPNVWKRIENLLAAEPRAAAAPAAAAPAGRGWRLAAWAGAFATVAAVAVTLGLVRQLSGAEQQLAQARAQGQQLVRQNAELVAQLQAQPDIRYVAVLADDKAAPAILATFDPRQGRLTLKRVAAIDEGPERSLQLWALPPQGAPRSLGVLGTEQVVRLPAAEQQVGQVPALAISLEPKGGVPSERGPTGPVLFKGAVLQTPV